MVISIFLIKFPKFIVQMHYTFMPARNVYLCELWFIIQELKRIIQPIKIHNHGVLNLRITHIYFRDILFLVFLLPFFHFTWLFLLFFLCLFWRFHQILFIKFDLAIYGDSLSNIQARNKLSSFQTIKLSQIEIKYRHTRHTLEIFRIKYFFTSFNNYWS